MAEQHKPHGRHGHNKPAAAPAAETDTGTNLKAGQHVLADFGDGTYVIAHLLDDGHQNAAGETKYQVQAPNGQAHDLTFREGDDFDDAGTGVTFKRL